MDGEPCVCFGEFMSSVCVYFEMLCVYKDWVRIWEYCVGDKVHFCKGVEEDIVRECWVLILREIVGDLVVLVLREVVLIVLYF